MFKVQEPSKFFIILIYEENFLHVKKTGELASQSKLGKLVIHHHSKAKQFYFLTIQFLDKLHSSRKLTQMFS